MNSIIKTIAIAGTLALAATSCKKDLALGPLSNLSSTNFFKTEADIDQALGGVYNKLLTFPDINNLYLSEVRSNNYYVARQDAARDYYSISAFEVNAQLGSLGTAWRNDYELIERANQVLDRIDGIAYTDTAKKARVKGQCMFLRALSYFELVKVFGGVPLITKSITSTEAFNYPRVGMDTVYNFIISELQSAATMLPASYSGSDLGRATKWAALGMLGRVYMYTAGYPMQKTANYALAKTVLQQVLASENTGWRFATNYADLFKAANDNKYNVFEVQYISGGLGLGSVIPGEVIPNDMDRKITPYGQYYMGGEPSADLMNSYEPGDVRKMLTLDSIYRTTTNIYTSKRYFKKFLDSASSSSALNSSDWSINFPLLRGEDIMLMYAETINETSGPTGEAIALVNRIRKRAGLADLTAASTANHDAFKLALERERRSEFAWEGLYWYDLIRTNRVLAVMNPWLTANYTKTMDLNQIIYPIPLSEMLIKPGLYTQNPGY